MRFYPEVMIRLDDYEVFSLNEDSKTYSSSEMKRQFPRNTHNKYTLSDLEDSNFSPLIKCPKMFALYHEQKKTTS
jgi:hypothetical protein